MPDTCTKGGLVPVVEELAGCVRYVEGRGGVRPRERERAAEEAELAEDVDALEEDVAGEADRPDDVDPAVGGDGLRPPRVPSGRRCTDKSSSRRERGLGGAIPSSASSVAGSGTPLSRACFRLLDGCGGGDDEG